MDQMKYCTSCGAENKIDSKFCSSCGTKMEETSFEDELDIHYEDETVYNNAELFDNYYASAYTEVDEDFQKSEPENNYEVTGVSFEEPYKQPVVASAPNYSTYTSNTATAPAKTNNGGNIGFSIASMICGIFSIICCCSVFGFVTGIVALIFGIVTVKSNFAGKGMAIAGIITGGIGIFLWIVFMVIGSFGLFLELLEY